MNCTNLNTAAEILEAFRACKNPGEEIELFECLATRPDPPVGAFVDILRSIKLEAVLALTIQAFGKITDADIKARLKESEDLLTILSQQAQSGSSDLIRWSAATTIDNLGFDFIAVSQYLTEEPKKIAEKIVQSKVKRFAEQNLLHSNDYSDFALFWVYGALERLKQISLDSKYAQGLQIDLTCQFVMHYLNLKGIKDVNAALQRAELMGDNAFPIDENEVFEGSAQRIAKEKLEDPANINELDILFDILFENQLHCLQSNNLSTRKSAAQFIYTLLETTVLEQLKQSNPTLGIAVFIFSQDWYQLKWVPSGKRDSSGLQELIQSYEFNSLSYNQLESVAQQFEILVTNLKRKKVKQDCQEWLNHALNEIQKRNQAFQTRVNQSIALREKLDRQLNQIRDINRELYDQVFSKMSFDNPPQLSVENEQYSQILNMYDKSLREKLGSLQKPVSNFYDSLISNQLSPIQAKIKIANQGSELVVYMTVSILIGIVILTMIYAFQKFGDLAGAIVIGFIQGCIFAVIPAVILNFSSEWISNYCKSKVKEYEAIYNRKQFQLENEKKQLLNLLNV
jgi:hypothetical protein